MKDKGSFDQPEITVFETGTNKWKHYDSWPPAISKPVPFYLQAGGKMSQTKPTANKSRSEYVSDPNKPVPYTNGIWSRRNNEYMAEDQRFAAQRSDVLSFQTETLEKDIILTGEIGARLFVSTTGSDADFVVKLIDVWPGGSYLPVETSGEDSLAMGEYQQMVRAEVFRGKFRNSFEKPEPFVKNKIEKIDFNLNEVAHTFKKGHRVMVQVQSSWFPLVDRNPQQFGYIPGMDAKDFKKATVRIYHDAMHSSNIILPVMEE